MTSLYRDDADLFPEIRSSMNESPRLLPGMDSRLYRAAEQGSVLKLEGLIAEELNILQEFTALGNSSLHIAVSRGNLRFIKKLLEVVKVNLVEGRKFVRAKNSDGNSALHLAAFYGRYELVEEFLSLLGGDEEAGNFLKFQNDEGNTALHEAAKGGNYEVVGALLRHSRDEDDLIGLPNNAGATALFVACQSGHEEIVERLLRSMTPNSNMKRGDGQTPLHAAVFYRHAGVVRKLLQHRPDLEKETDGCGRTAMHMLALSSPRPNFNIIRAALQSWEIRNIARLLLKKNNSLCYQQDNEKKTPLHMALELAQYALVHILLSYGRDSTEIIDRDGRKPLHVAILNAVRETHTGDFYRLYRFKIMLLALMSKESLNHRDNRGRTPLHIAMQNTTKDKPLYESITQVLQMNGALLSPEILKDKRNMELSLDKSEIETDNMSINAVLIATVSFAAAFTLPGGLTQADEDKRAVFYNTFLFKLFLICDTFSFCASIAATIIIQILPSEAAVYSQLLLWSALISLLVAFGAAVHLVIAPSRWLAGIVWTMVSVAPFTILLTRFHSKRFIFRPERYSILNVLAFLVSLITLTIFWFIWDILIVFLFIGLIYNAAHWIRKLLRRKC